MAGGAGGTRGNGPVLGETFHCQEKMTRILWAWGAAVLGETR